MTKALTLLFLISSSSFAKDICLDFNYEITNFTADRKEVRDLFSKLWASYKIFDRTHCYRKAHVLANQMKNMNILSAKAYVFFDAKMNSKTGWWYHVAPYIHFYGNPIVVDRGLYEGATTLKEWLDASSADKGCKQIYSYQEYLDEKKNYKRPCMYLLAPMYNYGPGSLKLALQGFEASDLWDSIQVIPKINRNRYLSKYPIKDL